MDGDAKALDVERHRARAALGPADRLDRPGLGEGGEGDAAARPRDGVAVEPAPGRVEAGLHRRRLPQGRGQGLGGPQGREAADHRPGAAVGAGIVADEVGVALADRDRSDAVPSAVAAIWAWTVVVPLPNSAVPTRSS